MLQSGMGRDDLGVGQLLQAPGVVAIGVGNGHPGQRRVTGRCASSSEEVVCQGRCVGGVNQQRLTLGGDQAAVGQPPYPVLSGPPRKNSGGDLLQVRCKRHGNALCASGRPGGNRVRRAGPNPQSVGSNTSKKNRAPGLRNG